MLMIEEFSDSLDNINDAITDLTVDNFTGMESVETLIVDINKVLGDNGMSIDFNDVENVFSEWEEPTEFEAVNVVFPLYDSENSVTEYNLSITYAYDDANSKSLIIDAEVQYEWELDSEIGNDYIDIDDSEEYRF